MSTRSEASPVLVATQLSKRYGALQACDQVSLSVLPGEIHALIGPNGAGKSTLINVLSGAVPPDSGGLLLNGRDVTRAPMQQRVAAGLARSYQITNIFQKSSVMDNLLIAVQAQQGSQFSFLRSRERDTALHQAAQALALECSIDASLWDLPAGTLPHGEQA